MIEKLSFKYLIKNFRRSLILILCVASVCSFITLKSLIEKNSIYNEMLFVHSLYAGYDAKFFDTNINNINKIEGIKGVKKVIYTNDLNDITCKNGVNVGLYNYNEPFYKLNRFKIIEGRLPKDSKEIVIEKRAIDEINKHYKLNTKLAFTKILKKKSNSKYDITTESVEYKVVGIIDRNHEFYNNDYNLMAFTTNNRSELYNGFIIFDQNSNKRAVYEEVRQKSGISDENLRFNEQLSMAKGEYEESKSFKNYKEVFLLLITSLLLIFNIFNIFTSSFVKEIGELKIIGASRKKIIKLFLIQFAFIWLIGYLFGITLGTIISKTVVENFIFKTFINTRFIFTIEDIVYPLIITFFIVLVSSFLPIVVSSNKSGLECINENYKNKNNKTISVNSSNIYFKNFINMITRNISNVLVVIISFSILGIMFFETSFRMTNNFNIIDMQQNNLFINDMLLSPNLVDTNIAVSNINKDEYNLVKKMGVYKFIDYKKEIPYSYLTLNKGDISEKYYKYKKFEGNYIDMPITLKSYSENMNNFIKSYIKEGSINSIDNNSNEYIPALITDKYYNMANDENEKIFSEKVKLNGLYNIKVFSIIDGKVKKHNEKIKIAGIIDDDWLFKGNSNFGFNAEVIIPTRDMDALGMKDKYTQIGFINSKGNSEKNREKISRAFNSNKYSIFDINSYVKKNKINEEIYLKEKISQISILVILTMLNLILMIRSNIIKRKNEFMIMRALGMTLRDKYKWIIFDNLLIATVVIIINIISAAFIYYNNSLRLNQLYMDIYSKPLFLFKFPIKEIFIYIFIVFISILFGILFSNRLIKDNDIN